MDKRKHIRYTVRAAVALQASDIEHQGILINIGNGGALFHTGGILSDGTVASMIIPVGGGGKVARQGKILRVGQPNQIELELHEDVSEGDITCALNFENPFTDEEIENILQYVNPKKTGPS